MEERIEKLRRRVAKVARNRRGRRKFDAGLRGAIVEMSEAWAASGGRQHVLARQLGLSAQTLSGWRHASRHRGVIAQREPSIRAVTIVEDERTDSSSSQNARAPIAITLPRGLVISGLDVAAAIRIARELG